MNPVHDSGPWTRSKEGVYGPPVHVLSSPVLNGSLLTPNFSWILFFSISTLQSIWLPGKFFMGAFSRTGTNDNLYNLRDWSHHFVFVTVQSSSVWKDVREIQARNVILSVMVALMRDILRNWRVRCKLGLHSGSAPRCRPETFQQWCSLLKTRKHWLWWLSFRAETLFNSVDFS